MDQKLMVVDDDHDVCDSIARFLVKRGYQVEVAYDALAALERLKASPPSLVLLDITMEGMNGIDFMAAAKAIKPDLAVIMVTGMQDEATAQNAMDMGAADYITKPIDLKYLETSVKAKLTTMGS